MEHPKHPNLMFEYCRDRLQQLKAELTLLREMIAYLESRAAIDDRSTPKKSERRIANSQ